jgi:hypothetical protein
MNQIILTGPKENLGLRSKNQIFQKTNGPLDGSKKSRWEEFPYRRGNPPGQ